MGDLSICGKKMFTLTLNVNFNVNGKVSRVNEVCTCL
jgi:hypothetical protein